MNRGSSFAKSPREDSRKSENSKAFKDISKYFSKEEWANMGYSEKLTCVYMKRNCDTITHLGLKATLPTFMCPKKRATKSNRRDSKDWSPRDQKFPDTAGGSLQFGNIYQQRKILICHLLLDEPTQGASNVQEKKHLKVMPKKSEKKKDHSKLVPATSGSEQAQKQLCTLGKASASAPKSKETSGPKEREINIWDCRLRERKNLVAYEEISDPEEEN
ncbi:putative protein SSX6 [Hippopotamus amphibius kiboko]|uniref:putative protein SSX6 n=1 Tax=Hippopotamus amphibius kiboko TaxID=575201 RepID=UPI0025983367|nr:putative protein SSX6 [Hippopotamus amphibius kiboko]